MNLLTIQLMLYTYKYCNILNPYCGLLCVNHVFLRPPLVFCIERAISGEKKKDLKCSDITYTSKCKLYKNSTTDEKKVNCNAIWKACIPIYFLYANGMPRSMVIL